MPTGSGDKPRILIFGTGSGGVNFYKSYCKCYRVIGFLDNSQRKHGQLLFGKVIHAPQSIQSLSFDKIIIASDYYREIHQQLLNELAVANDKVAFSHAELWRPPSQLSLWRNTLERFSYKRLCEQPGLVSSALFQLFSQRQDKANTGLFKRMTLRWLDTMHDNKVHVFRPGMADTVQGPRVVGQQVPPINIALPEVALYHFTQAQVCSVSRSVILGGEQLVLERILTAPPHDADYSGAHVLYQSNRHALIVQQRTADIEKGVLINGFTETNYYHWLLEIVSQLQFIDELPEQYADYPVLISASSQTMPSIKTFIDAFNIDRPFIFLEALVAYNIGDVLLINAPNNLVPNLKDVAANVAENGFIRKESLDFMRSKALPLAQAVDPDTLPKRVFMARKHFLRAYNQADIFSVLEPFGFTCVYMEELDFSHQVAVMANAEVIVGPTGAAWGNILFASKGTKALCWMAREAGELSCFSNLADKVGVDLDYIHYVAGTSDSRQIYSQEYSLDKNLVSRWAQENLSASASAA